MTSRLSSVCGVFALASVTLGVSFGPVNSRESKDVPLPPVRPAAVEMIVEHVSPETNKATKVFRRPGLRPFVYFSGLAIDADGAPNAYHPNDKPGIDALEHAGSPGNWWALALDEGRPVVQSQGEYSGFYVSMTWLSREDDLYSQFDPEYWLDARKVRYIAIPETVFKAGSAEKGDLAYVFNLANGKSSYAIVGDWGTENTLGEGSIALAEALGVDGNPRDGGQDNQIAYVVFPGSHSRPRWPRQADDMSRQADKLLHDFGGRDAVQALRMAIATHARK